MTNIHGLDEWEKHLKSLVGEGQLLLGELGFRRKDLDNIADLMKYRHFLGSHGKEFSVREKFDRISREWPLTFALYLVLEGIYDYESGEYWESICKYLGLPSNQTDHWGQRFLDILADYDLPTFKHSGGLTYVTPILLHGGIPNDFLDEFFNFLWKQEKGRHRISLDSTSLLHLWRQQPEEYFRYLPAPVGRFLEYGGQVASDFVERCLDLFDTESLEEAEALVDLPPRVTRAYGQWLNEKGVPRRTTTPRAHLQRPILVITPYGSGVSLYLPVQQFAHEIAPNQLDWHLSDLEKRIICHMRRIEGGLQFEVEDQVIIPPAEKYTIHLEADGESLQTWTLSGLDEPPILFFNPYDAYEGDLLLDQERFRPGERWLLYPQGCSWKETGHSQKLSELPRLGGKWQGYRLEVWRLAPGEMALRDENGHVHPFVIIHEKVRQRPHLSEDNRLPLPTVGTGFPFYIGRPPTLMLYTNQPQRWQVAVRAAGGAQPGGHRQKRVSDLPFTREGDSLRIELSARDLLGEAPVGKFEVVVRGPLGQSYHFGLRCIPALEVDGLSQLYLANNNETAQFMIRCDPATQIRQNPPQAGVDITIVGEGQEQQEYGISVASEIKQVNLQLRHDYGVVMPLTIPVHRLRWALWTGNDEHSVRWQTEPSEIYPGALSDGALWVDVPIVRENPLRIGWQLIDTQEGILRELPPGEQPVQRRLEWSLAEVTSIWRERQETLCWQLLIQIKECDEPLIIPTFYLLPTPDFGEVIYEWRSEDEKVYLSLLLERSQPGKYILRLWPLDRPWITEPLELLLPEPAGIQANWQRTVEELPAEAYQAELVAHNPWRSTQPQRPKPGASGTFLIKPPGLGKYYAEIIELRDRGTASIEQLLALLAHQYYNDQLSDLHKTNRTISNMAGSLDPVWLLYWANSIKQFDNSAYTATRIKLFLPHLLAVLAQNYDDLTIRKYFAHLPDKSPPQLMNKIALNVLRSDLRAYFPSCLEVIFQQGFQGEENQEAFDELMDALVNDVANGILTVNKAIELLRPHQEAAMAWLVKNGGLEASEILHGLTVYAQLEPNWVAPGILLDSPLGLIKVEKLRQRVTNETRFCAPLAGDFYAEGKLAAKPTDVLVRLDLHSGLLHFTKSEPSQCLICEQMFTSLADCSRHHQTAHPELKPERKRLKQDRPVRRLRSRFVTVEPEEETADT